MSRPLLQVMAPHFCAGVEFAEFNGVWKVARAAPILRWMMFRTWPQLRPALHRRRWRWEWVR